jgi:hypothetical protein
LRSPRARGLALFAAIACLAAVPASAAAASSDRGRPVKVMTRNLYLGGDIGKPARAAVNAGGGIASLIAFGNATAALAATVDQTNFPARAKLLAAEIAEREPDLIGIQEAAVWRSGPLELPNPDGTLGNFALPNAEHVDYDFREILLDAIADAGENYKIVTDTQEADVEAPAFIGIPGQPGFTPLGDHRLTMHDLILRRVEGDIKVRDKGTGNYSEGAQFKITLSGREFNFRRGYGWADVTVKKRNFRFVNTHLESELSIFALLQAQELAAGPAAPQDQPVVLVCDCNSDPLNGTIKPNDLVPHWAAYRFLTGPAGFTDEWLLVHTAEEGFTSGLNETVNNPDLSTINHRIDMVFGRRADGSAIPADRGWITGNEARTADGLWASDHMGVVVRLHP